MVGSARTDESMKSWWVGGNAIAIWAVIIGLFSFIIFSSRDYAQSYWNFDKLGLNQLILAGIITFLLLYKNISKIKIGTIVEIETREALKATIRGLSNTINAVDYSVQDLPPAVLPDPRREQAMREIREAKRQIITAKEVLERAETF